MVRKVWKGKKALALLLSVLLLMAIFPAAAVADDALNVGQRYFSNYSTVWWKIENNCLIIGGNGAIPNSNNQPYFQYREKITEIRIEEGIKKIGDYAFYYQSVTDYTFPRVTAMPTIPSTVTEIGNYAFYQCRSFGGTLSLPSSLTSIGICAFYDCSELTGELVIPNALQRIGQNAFSGCSGLQGVRCDTLAHWFNIFFENQMANPLNYAGKLYIGEELYTQLSLPAGVDTIPQYAFVGCTSFDSMLHIPPGLKSIRTGAFTNCTGLTGVNCDSLAQWCELNFADTYATPLRYAKMLYIDGTLFTSFALPAGCTSVKAYAFYGCKSLVGPLVIPEGLTSISNSAFSECTGITRVDCASLEQWYQIDFQNSEANPLKLTGNLYINNAPFSEFSVPQSITEIKQYVFYNYDRLSGSPNLRIPENVTSIGQFAFYGCDGLTAGLELAGSVTNIGQSAFSNCRNLKSLTMEKDASVAREKTLNGNVFDGCTALTDVVIADDVQSIGARAFYECTALRNLTLGTDDSILKTIGTYAFYNLDKLVGEPESPDEGETGSGGVLVIPPSVTSIGESAFYDCDNIRKLIIKEKQPAAGEERLRKTIADGIWYNVSGHPAHYGVFRSCDKLTDVVIADDVVYIGVCAFMGCNSLENLTLGTDDSTLETIGNDAFYNCPVLVGEPTVEENGEVVSGGVLVIPPSVTSIGYGAFYNCDKITKLIIKEKPTAEGEAKLNKVIYSGRSSTYEYGAFSYCNGLTDVVIADDVAEIGNYSFANCYNLKNLTLGTDESILQYIGYYAFNGCQRLVGEPVVTVDGEAVSGGVLVIPPSVVQVYNSAFQECYAVQKLLIKSKTYLPGETKLRKVIASYAFTRCTNLTDAVISDEVVSIQEAAFKGCGSLENLTFGADKSTLEYIGESAFENCNSFVGEPTVEENGEIVSGGTFVIPSSVKTIGSRAFYNCSSLAGDLVIPDKVKSLGSFAFYNCSGFEGDLVIGSGVTKIDVNTFYNCSGLNGTLTIGQNVTQINAYAFYNCTHLTGKLVLPAGLSLSNIGKDAFHACAAESTADIREFFEDYNENDRFIHYGLTEHVDPTPEANGYDEYSVFCSDCGGNNRVKTQRTELLYIPISEITADVYNVEIVLGNMYQLTVGVNPDNASNKNVIFSSDNEDVATVTEAGVIKPVTFGTVNITISPADGTDSTSTVVAVSIVCRHRGENIVTVSDERMATCTAGGSYLVTVTCPICGESYIEERLTDSDPLGHDLTHYLAKEATCTEPGYTAYDVCSRCDYVSEHETYPASGHALTHHEAKAPTCSEAGWEAYETCANCDYSTYREIPALGHNLIVNEGKPETCTEGGYRAYLTCTRCEYSTYQAVDSLNHDLVAVNAKAPTCTEAGWEAYVACTRCDYTTRETIPALGHALEVAPGTPATCTETGSSAYILCTRCDFATEQHELPALSHDLKNYAGQAATCVTPGWEDYVACSRCDYSTYQAIPVLNHDFVVHNGTPATCTETGLSAYLTCTRCDFETEPLEMPALGHSIVTRAAKAPTCTEVGWEAYEVCRLCDYTTYVELEALGHKFGEWMVVKAPTATQNGLERRYCERGDTYEERVIEASGDWGTDTPDNMNPATILKNLIDMFKRIVQAIKITSEDS